MYGTPLHQGYKICLRVEANGCGLGEGTHVSVFICFMRGEFDESLKWPFRGVIAFQLLDQFTGNDHVACGVSYDNLYSDYDGRVSGERSGGMGWHKFIAHSELKPKYLQKDSLSFQVHRVELQ